MKNQTVFLIALLASLFIWSPVLAESVPPLINYQGKITDTDGNPVTGTQKLTVNIYDSATEGTLLWGPQVFATVPLINGYFNVILGPVETDDSGIALVDGDSIDDAFTGGINCYLEVQVDGVSTVIPRQRILSSPYAVQAEIAATVVPQGVTTEMLADEAVTSLKIANGAVTGDKRYNATDTSNSSSVAIPSSGSPVGFAIPALQTNITLDHAAIFLVQSYGGQSCTSTLNGFTSTSTVSFAHTCSTVNSSGDTIKTAGGTDATIHGRDVMIYNAPAGTTTCTPYVQMTSTIVNCTLLPSGSILVEVANN